MTFDQRFMTVHPATKRWWKQRAKCEACAKCINGGALTGGMRCADSPKHNSGAHLYCIDAREPGGVCGPKATRFTPKEK